MKWSWKVTRLAGIEVYAHTTFFTVIVFGLLLTLAWARLAAPDIALAEAAIGAGLTGALLLALPGMLAAAVLLHLTRILPGWGAPGPRLRAGLAAGFLIFLAVAGALLARGALLEYPPVQAGMLILLIEAGLTVSLGLILAGLFLALSRDSGDEA